MLRGLIAMLFPVTCRVCGHSLVNGERALCLDCYDKLPRTEFSTLTFSELHKRLAAPGVPLCRAGGWFYYYRDSRYASLIRDAKYNDRPSLATWMGERCAAELLATGFFDGIDLLLPVPMHPLKRIMRGYNQSEVIARAISAATKIPVGDHLRSTRYHSTQTRKTAAQRVANAEGFFEARPTHRGIALEGLHVLIIDDVITTGATMLANCRAVLKAAPTATVSVLSMGVAHMR